ncbi:MAG: dihydrofolate reductase [Erysipelotrichaceae bacterium]
MIILIVAIDESGLIGSRGKMAWHNQDDLNWFAHKTKDSEVLMGRTTFEHLPKPLLNRYVHVVTSHADFKIDQRDGCVCLNPISMIKQFKDEGKNLYICGGKQIYELAYDYVDEMYVSIIPGIHEGDTYLDLDLSMFYCESIIENNNFTLKHYRRGENL